MKEMVNDVQMNAKNVDKKVFTTCLQVTATIPQGTH